MPAYELPEKVSFDQVESDGTFRVILPESFPIADIPAELLADPLALILRRKKVTLVNKKELFKRSTASGKELSESMELIKRKGEVL